MYLSGKQEVYRYKVEVSVLSSGLKIWRTAHYPGSVADLEVFKKIEAFYEEPSEKVIRNLEYGNIGVLEQYSSDY